MDCEQFDQIVMDLLYGEADEQQSAEAKRHAERCERCAAQLSDLRSARKGMVLPLVEAPSGFEPRLMEAARRFQREIPWPRRIGRWVSWAGGYAMRPQLAMAALLLLMIGSSLLLIRGRPGGEQVDVVRVTEQGVPEREGAEPGIAPDPDQLPPSAENSARAKEARGRSVPDEGVDETVREGARARAPSALALADAGAEGGVFIPSPTGDRAAQQQFNVQRGGAGEPPADAYGEAMALYRARDFANAYRAFDGIAMAGGPSAPSAALYAAKAVRASSGCGNALPRFESVAARYGGSGAGTEAKWEVASCARIMGDLTRARIIYRDLARVDSQRDRAEAELARISGQGQPARAAPPAASPSRNADKAQDKAPDPPPNAYGY
jgi:hypothetical protein